MQKNRDCCLLVKDIFVLFIDFEPIIATVAYLIDKNPQCQFWTTYQVRRYSAHVSAVLYLYCLPYLL